MKRQFDEVERKITQKNFDRMKSENEHYENSIKYCDFMMDTGMKVDAYNKLQQLALNKKEWERLLQDNNEDMKIAEDQLINGVEVKELKPKPIVDLRKKK